MSSRTIQNPGIEINEIDRSQYGKVDYSLQNAPTSLIYGFASKGEDCALTWVNSKQTLDNTFGKPTNEYERYFYNTAYEILSRSGTCIAAKLPYDNDAYQMYNCIDYLVDGNAYAVSELSTVVGHLDYDTIGEVHEALIKALTILNEPYNASDVSTISKMANVVQNLVEKYGYMNNDAIETIRNIRDVLKQFIEHCTLSSDFSILMMNDSNLTSCVKISFLSAAKDTMQDLDAYLTSSKSPRKGHIRIYDMTRAQYGAFDPCNGCVIETDDMHQDTATNQCLGIVPVIVTPANAMFFQNVLEFPADAASNIDYTAFSQVSSFSTVPRKNVKVDFSSIEQFSDIPFASIPPADADSNGYDYESLSRIASMTFPDILFNGPNHFDTRYLKLIGVAVFKAYLDADSNKLGFELLESFVGSLKKGDIDPVTNANIFIDDVVNQKSSYIKLFSNIGIDVTEHAMTYVMSQQPAVSLGFYHIDCAKKINYVNSVMKPLQTILANAANPNTLPLDIVVDGGVSNIAQLAYLSENQTIDADKMPDVAQANQSIDLDNDISLLGWKAVLKMLDNFVKYTRKDCMFIADGVRSFCLDGNAKYVRKTCPQNTVANTILPKFRYMCGALNSSYSAGYCNWFYQQDYGNSTRDTYLWMPPSSKVVGVYIYCSTYFHPWSAPAGNIRGIVPDAVDVAFIPLDSDAGQIYSNQWNYAMSYPFDGIVVEGHKTFQTQNTALDRVNVRRLMLDIEKKISRIARYFVYEGNTAYNRQRFVDEARTVLEDAVSGDGIKEYAIKCDEELNTIEVIENNEMRCKIAVKPVKVVDYIVIDLIATRQSANVSEEVLR